MPLWMTSEHESEPAVERCARCDSILPEGAERCLMCGLPRPPRAAPPEAIAEPVAAPAAFALAPVEPAAPAPPLAFGPHAAS